MAEEEETPVVAEEQEATMDINTALREVLKKARIHDGLRRGLQGVRQPACRLSLSSWRAR